MSWLELDDRILEHPKFIRAVIRGGSCAIHLWLGLRAYAGQNLTDGHVPADMIGEVKGPRKPKDRTKALQALIDVGLLENVDDGVQMHDYAQWSRTREEILRDREKSADRKRRSRRGAVATPPAVTVPVTAPATSPDLHKVVRTRAAAPPEEPVTGTRTKPASVPPPPAVKEAPPPSDDHARIEAVLRKHPVFAMVNHRHIANQGVMRMQQAKKIEWIIESIEDFAAKRSCAGLSLLEVQSGVVGFIKRADAPKLPSSGNGGPPSTLIQRDEIWGIKKPGWLPKDEDILGDRNEEPERKAQ